MPYRQGLEELNKRIEEARTKIDREAHLRNMLTSLDDQEATLLDKIDELTKQLAKEEKDVEKLEGKGITAMFASILGSKEERLEKERREALAAKLKCDEAQAELEELSQSRTTMQTEVESVGGADTELAVLMEEKDRWVREHGGEDGKALFALGDQSHQVVAQVREIDEAMSAAQRALQALNPVSEAMASASNWGTFDMLGGGLIATAVKHSKVDEAHRTLPAAQSALSALQRELKDVQISMPVSVHLSELDSFADYFFDGLIMDWSVQSKIESSKASVEAAIHQVDSVVAWLTSARDNAMARYDELSAERESLLERWG